METRLYETGAKLPRRYSCRSSGEKKYVRTRMSLEELQKEEKCSQYTQNSQEKGRNSLIWTEWSIYYLNIQK
jgi:hypothetical protein